MSCTSHPDCCLSGVAHGDENELKSIASDPDDTHMFAVSDFEFLLSIVDDLTGNLCNSIRRSGVGGVT